MGLTSADLLQQNAAANYPNMSGVFIDFRR